MISTCKRFYTIVLGIALTLLFAVGIPAHALAAQTKDFVVVLDAGHGGKDHGAIDNGVKEKDINLAVTLRLGELIKKKLKNTKVVYTRDDDTFVSLQGRADIANKAKGDLFISIHTNSVDAKNKNRRTVAGASVYTQGSHKDDANLAVAKRENAVIELENGYEQKYSGFDPNKVESYIIFEMAAKQNLAQSHRFAKNVQSNLVKLAGRKDRGVHQAGFWVLWATSMPSALVELDFICNPESAKFMGSKNGVDKLAEAIFEAVKTYEQNYRQKQRMLSRSGKDGEGPTDFGASVHHGVAEELASIGSYAEESTSDSHDSATTRRSDSPAAATMLGVGRVPESDEKDMSHTNLKATKNQPRARHAADGRRRRSTAARSASESRDLEVNHILVREEHTGEMTLLEPTVAEHREAAPRKNESEQTAKGKKSKNKKEDKKKGKQKTTASKESSTRGSDKRQWVSEVNKIAAREKAEEKRVADENSKAARHAGSRKSLKSSKSNNK